MGGRVADSDKDCDQSQNDRRNECSERLDRDALPERLTLYPSSEPPGRRLAFHADIVAGGEVNPRLRRATGSQLRNQPFARIAGGLSGL
jgi:hypothetical protein